MIPAAAPTASKTSKAPKFPQAICATKTAATKTAATKTSAVKTAAVKTTIPSPSVKEKGAKAPKGGMYLLKKSCQHIKEKGENIDFHIMTAEGGKRDAYCGGWTLTAKTQMHKVPLNKYTTAELSCQGCRCVREKLVYDRARAHFYILADRRCAVIPLDKANDGWLKNTIRPLGDVILDVHVELAPFSDSKEEREDDYSEEGSGSGEDNDSDEEAQEYEVEVQEDEGEDDEKHEDKEENDAK